MSIITIIGDVHSKTKQYQKILRQHYKGKRTIQIGDMGIGFKGVGLHKMPDNHKWFRGNHDNPEKCRANSNYLGDYGYLPDDKLFWVAGAWSIDRAMRIEGISWWPDEELSYSELDKVIELYESIKPDFVISHEAPSKAAGFLLIDLIGASMYYSEKATCGDSRTSSALQAMFDIHQPKEWIFGHYHYDFTFQFQNTKFTCVSELSRYDLDTD